MREKSMSELAAEWEFFQSRMREMAGNSGGELSAIQGQSIEVIRDIQALCDKALRDVTDNQMEG